VTGDGAFDARRCHTAILERGGTAVIPIRKNGNLWKEDTAAAGARNDILRATRRFGRAIWKQWSGYHARSRVEARMRCLKAFVERISSRDTDRQTTDIHTGIDLSLSNGGTIRAPMGMRRCITDQSVRHL